MLKFVKAAIAATLVFGAHSAHAATVVKAFEIVTTQNKLDQPIGFSWDYALDAGLNRNFNVIDPGVFKIFDDGTATVSATVFNVDDASSGFVFELNMDSDPLMPFEFKAAFPGAIAPTDPNLLNFFDPQSGTASGFGVLDGFDFDVSRFPADGSTAFQYGGGEGRGVRGVNQHNDDFGFSVWLGAGNVTSSTCAVCANPEIVNIVGEQFDLIGNLVPISAVPLPAGGMLLFTALGTMALVRRRRS